MSDMDAGMATNGEEELSLPRTATERMLALVDLVISNMDGVELLNKVANDQRPVVHHAHALMSARLRLLCASLTDLLLTLSVPVVLKPFDNDALLTTVVELACRLTWPQALAAE